MTIEKAIDYLKIAAPFRALTMEKILEFDEAICMAVKALEGQRWIPVAERQPEATENILICDIDEDIYIGHRTRYGEYYPDFCGDRIKTVTAWKPLPEPWKGEDYETN